MAYTLTQSVSAGSHKAAREPLVRRLVRWMVFVIALLSSGNFNPNLLGPGLPDLDATHWDQSATWQQYAVVALWLGVIGCSLLTGAFRTPLKTQRLGLATVFLCYIAISILWSDYPPGAAPKALVFITTSIGVWLLTSVITIDELFDIFRSSLFVLMLISAASLILMPQIAIADDYFHAGDWQGIFVNKQELGIHAAIFSLLTLTRLLRGWRWTDAAGLVLGVGLMVGSGSRGAAVISVVAPLGILLARRNYRLLQALVAIIPIEISLALVSFAYLAYTGADQFLISGESIDLSERTIIWSYALNNWTSRPWLGFGINGFWSDPGIAWGFARVHNWLVPDYHSGYLAILIDCGIVGMGIFLMIIGRLCSDLRYLLRWNRLGASGETILGFVILLFTIDLTETAFLRSTNFADLAFVFVLIWVFSLRHESSAVAGQRWRSHPAPIRASHP